MADNGDKPEDDLIVNHDVEMIGPKPQVLIGVENHEYTHARIRMYMKIHSHTMHTYVHTLYRDTHTLRTQTLTRTAHTDTHTYAA